MPRPFRPDSDVTLYLRDRAICAWWIVRDRLGFLSELGRAAVADVRAYWRGPPDMR